MFDRATTTCLFGELYLEVRQAGALALIDIVPWTPSGFFALRHQTWDAEKYASPRSMAVISASDPTGSILQKMRDCSPGPCMLKLAPPYDVSWAVVYRSWTWMLSLRVFAPAFALYTAYLAAQGLYLDRFKAKWSVCQVMYTVELPCLTLAGAALALGQYGPMAMPERAHIPFINLMNGGSVFTTVLVALFLREEGRHLRTQLPRRPLVAQYRATIALAAVCFLAYDFLSIIFAFTNLTTAVWDSTFWALYVVAIPVQICVAVNFFVQARSFSGPLWFYLYPTDETREKYGQKSVGVARVGRLALWLSASGACIVVTVVCGIIILFRAIGAMESDPVGGMILFIVVSFGRIGASFAQVPPSPLPELPVVCIIYLCIWPRLLTASLFPARSKQCVQNRTEITALGIWRLS